MLRRPIEITALTGEVKFLVSDNAIYRELAELPRLGSLFGPQKFLHDEANNRRRRRSNQGN